MKIKDMAIIAMVGGLMSVSCKSQAAEVFNLGVVTPPYQTASECRQSADVLASHAIVNEISKGNLYEMKHYINRSNKYFVFLLSFEDSLVFSCTSKNEIEAGFIKASINQVTGNPDGITRQLFSSKVVKNASANTPPKVKEGEESKYPENKMKLWKSCELPDSEITVSEYDDLWILQSWSRGHVQFELAAKMEDAFRGVNTFTYGDEMYAVDGNEVRVIKGGDIEVYQCKTYY